MTRRLALVLLQVLFLTGCGPPQVLHTPYEHDLWPLADGAQWDYRVVDDKGGVAARSIHVVGAETLGGVAVVRVESTQDGVVVQNWLKAGDWVLILQRVTLDPSAMAATEEFVPGLPWSPGPGPYSEGQTFDLSWVEKPSGDGSHETWTVEETAENVTVDAGTFKAVKMQRVRSDGTTDTLWFAPGVGLLRTEGTERVTLLSFSIP